MDTYCKRQPSVMGHSGSFWVGKQEMGLLKKIHQRFTPQLYLGWTYCGPDKEGRHGIEEKQ